MSDKQPEALRLAQAIEDGYYGHCPQAAAELRRLHEQNEKFKWQVRDTCARAEKAEAENERLLSVLRELVDVRDEANAIDDILSGPSIQAWKVVAKRMKQVEERARAALAKETTNG